MFLSYSWDEGSIKDEWNVLQRGSEGPARSMKTSEGISCVKMTQLVDEGPKQLVLHIENLSTLIEHIFSIFL